MAQYFHVIDQSDKTTDELQSLYPNIVEAQQTVSYVLNSDDQLLPQSQPVIVAGEQYMVLDNVIDQSTIKFQTQQFEVQQTPQQIYYMESEENGQAVETIQMAQPVVLNHQIQGVAVTQPTPSSQKLVMHHAPTTMVIQQPQLVQRQVTSSSPTTVQVPVQKRAAQSPLTMAASRSVVTSPQVTLTPRTSAAQGLSRLNIIRGVSPRPPLSSPVDGGQRPGVPRIGLPNRGAIMQRSVRGGVIQANGPRAIVMHSTPRTAKQFVQKKKAVESPNIQATVSTQNIEDVNSGTAVALENGNVISVAEYQQLLANRKKALENQLNQKQQMKATPPKMPQRRPPIRQNQRPNPEASSSPQLMSFGQQKTPSAPPPQISTVQTPPPPPPPKPQMAARIIQPPNQDNSRLPAVLRNFVPPPEIKEIISKTQFTPEFHNSIRMFVLLATGEQRLITFTMPKEDCTIQEILEQVGVPLQPDTKIAISETNADGINLVVTVGITDDMDDPMEAHEISQSPMSPDDRADADESPPVPELPPLVEPEVPKYITGQLAVCSHCGFLSDDFNKCIRCKRKLPDGIKSMPSQIVSHKPDMLKKQTIAINLKSNGNIKNPSLKKKPRPKPIDQEPVILTLSSDEEGEDEDKGNSDLDIKKGLLGSESFAKEPTINDIKDSVGVKGASKDDSMEEPSASISLYCRTVRIGSYRFTPTENVLINNKELIIKVPNPNDPKDIKTVIVGRNFIVKALVNFQKILPVVFYYVTPPVGETIRNELSMTEGGEHYFDPVSNEEAFKRITLLPETITEESKSIFKIIYGSPFNIMDELNPKEANNILIRTCPKEVTKCLPASSSNCSSDVRQLLIYPPGKGGLPINTEDYLCLAQDQFLNDVIIDFYLKYLVMNLPLEKREKVHVFSTFFYKRLTTKPIKPTRKSHPTELDLNLTAAQKRHCRVKNWTKSVNLFEKDFIVIPINENAHWFLAIICFPGMNGPHTFDGKPHKVEVGERKKKVVATIGSVMITQVKVEKQPAVVCDEADLSDKDEAEGDESELDSGEESEEVPPPAPVPMSKTRQPIQQPCILIFDSLAGASRVRVVATLRDYLSCEHKVKLGIAKVYNKDVIKGACPKVPQQTNYTDCGLYLLQYVESFFKNPIKDYHIPINELKTWFEEIVVTRKREEISNLIKELMLGYRKCVSILPSILFPTLNGELVEHPPEEEEEEEGMMMDEDEEEGECDGEDSGKDAPDVDGSDRMTDSESNMAVNTSQESDDSSPSKPTCSMQGFVEELVADEAPRPDIGEVPKQSNRDTMSYLKSKRIVRHKLSDSSDFKKFKLSTD